jgi:gamma-D-glutamyl-L-lysine dipeptidyl-peptidase
MNTLTLTLIAAILTWAAVDEPETTGVESDGRPPAPQSLKRIARKIEPDLKGQPDRLPQYVDFFRREVCNDPRMVVFDVSAAAQPGGKVTLTGFVEFPETRTSLEKFLSHLGFQIDNQLETLPAANLGERSLGFLKTSHCLSYDHPRGRRGAVSDCLFAEPLYLLREDGEQLLVHSGEGYLGYIPADQIHRVTDAEFAAYINGPSVRMIAENKVGNALTIPAGARLKSIRVQGDSATVQLPTGEQVDIPAANFKPHEPPTAEIDALIHNAELLLGTKYVWGGRGKTGIDCSGLVQIAYATAGLHLPRDANQQYLVGRLTATRAHRSAMRRGDTMYFIGDDGKVRHTAIYLGDDRYLNAEVPNVRVGSLNPAHQEFDQHRLDSFAFAKRLVD